MAIIFLSLMLILSSTEGFIFRHKVDFVQNALDIVQNAFEPPAQPQAQRIVHRPRLRQFRPTHQASQNTRFNPVRQQAPVRQQQAPVFQAVRQPAPVQTIIRQPAPVITRIAPVVQQTPVKTNIQPVQQQIDLPRGFKTNAFRFPQSISFRGSTNIRGKILENEFTTGNIVQIAKAQAKATLSILKEFEESEIAAEYIDPIFETSDCLTNLDDVSKLIEEGTSLIVDNSPEILYLEAIVNNLKNVTDVNRLIRDSSKMLRTLDILIPSLTKGSSNLCITSPEASVRAFKDLGNALEDIANSRNLNLLPRSRKLLEFSSAVMDQTADFLEDLNRSVESFKALCGNGSKNQVAIYNSIRDVMDSLGDLFKVMGFDDRSNDIKKQAIFIKKIVGIFDQLDDFDITLECEIDGSYENLAQTLDDLAEIVENVGIETLSKELGLDLDFINSV